MRTPENENLFLIKTSKHSCCSLATNFSYDRYAAYTMDSHGSTGIPPGLPIHRLEMILFMAGLMRRHRAILLEEPPTEGFEEMLAGAFSAIIRPFGMKAV